MAREYFCAYHSYLKSVEPLNDAERGRLFTACLEYSMTGKSPDLRGNERFVFPMIREQIDRDTEKYNAFTKKQSENASMRWHAVACGGISGIAKNAKEKEKEKENIKERTTNVVPKKIFSKPSVSEVEQYCRERGNGINAETFVDYYEARGWLFNGKQQMKDWKAAVRTWERNRQDTIPKEVNRYADLI